MNKKEYDGYIEKIERKFDDTGEWIELRVILLPPYRPLPPEDATDLEKKQYDKKIQIYKEKRKIYQGFKLGVITIIQEEED